MKVHVTIVDRMREELGRLPEVPPSDAARSIQEALEQVLDEVEQRIASGYSLRQIWDALTAAGLSGKFSTFKSAVARARAKRRSHGRDRASRHDRPARGDGGAKSASTTRTPPPPEVGREPQREGRAPGIRGPMAITPDTPLDEL